MLQTTPRPRIWALLRPLRNTAPVLDKYRSVNAVAESCFASLKAEIGTRIFTTRAEARRTVFAYLNYYNRNRLHSTLNRQTP
ncbi:transposase [Dactylosporangium vinaceum]|uniref:Integrase core domain-containing protein n=1 Tax=Dactylosporangium vinaceum TaxID=53362 RepID=A0ABV5MK65_9ACTN|nr:transposase [Dactylosporangium vinaceum]